jgi:hypothetical protein
MHSIATCGSGQIVGDAASGVVKLLAELLETGVTG